MPIDVNDYTQIIMGVEKEAKSAGLSKGDVLKTLNEELFTGDHQLFTDAHGAHPGDNLAATVRGANGREKTVNIRLAPRERRD